MTITKETTEDFFFTCKDCGAHGLEVSRQYSLVQYFEETISCECGEADEGIATQRDVRVTHAIHAWGPLEDDHHFTRDEQEEEDVEREVLHDRKILLAMSVVVLKVIALVVQGIEGRVFDFRLVSDSS